MKEGRLLSSIDPKQVQRQFSRAARRGGTDPLSREIDKRMQERLDYVRIAPGKILDLGCGQGASKEGLQTRYPNAALLQVDASLAALPPSKSPGSGWLQSLHSLFQPTASGLLPPICADALQLPIRPGSQDLIWSNMLLPWVDDLTSVFSEMARVLNTHGLLMFSALGPDTLKALEPIVGTTPPRIHNYPDMHDLGDALSRSGFSDPVVDMEILTVEYSTFEQLIRDLRLSGSTCANPDRPRGMTGKKTVSGWKKAWESLANQSTPPKVSVRFEIIYGHAWKAPKAVQADGRSIVSFMPRPAAPGN